MACDLNVLIDSITGDCSNTALGAFTINIEGEAPGYTLQWVSPFTYTLPLTSTTETFTGLTAGTYTFYVTDSCVPINGKTEAINVNISSGACVSIFSIKNTTCNFPNGALVATIDRNYGNLSYFLYEQSGSVVQQFTLLDALTKQVTFNTLTPGTYYVIANDGGGCTGKSESCIIKSSTTLNFGLYVQNSSNCGIDTGSIYVTGLTGTPPYTYNWSNGESGSFVTGLTQGDYSVTVEDATGCLTNVGATVSNVPQVSVTALFVTPPSCFSNDGEVTAVITGGTAPYYYSGTNGETVITFATSYTFTGLSSGFFGVKVTDAGLCNSSSTTSLFTPNSFSVLSVTTNNSICNNSGGSMDIFLVGASGEYTYSLTDSLSATTSVVVPATNYSFSNLSSGVYTLTISNGGGCVFTQNYTINNTTLFTLSASTVGTTCDNSDGSVTLSISSGGTPPFFYKINDQSITTSLLTYTFSGLSSGNYTATVTDAFYCEQLINFVVPSSNSINFNLAGVGTNFGQNNGSVYAFVTSGEPPFTLDWSDNIPSGQTGYTITGLSAGTYSLTITDDNGCVQSRDITLYGYNVVSSYELFNICSSNLDFTGKLSKRGIKQYLLDGFSELTSGDTGCLLSQTLFELEVGLTGGTNSEVFFTGTTIYDYPTDNELYEVLERLLLEYDGINNVQVDSVNNTLIVETVCNPPIALIDANITVSLKIAYEINCVSCS